MEANFVEFLHARSLNLLFLQKFFPACIHAAYKMFMQAQLGLPNCIEIFQRLQILRPRQARRFMTTRRMCWTIWAKERSFGVNRTQADCMWRKKSAPQVEESSVLHICAKMTLDDTCIASLRLSKTVIILQSNFNLSFDCNLYRFIFWIALQS